MPSVSWIIEHFHQSCSAELGIRETTVFLAFWRRFGSVTG
jgi:hypothetical protein